jgi:AcrR family transcriptional regulator
MTEETDLRRKVLKASLALIEAGGLDRLSMREVARQAGVSHQAPYHHFGDREAILAAIATEGFAMLRQDLVCALDKLAASRGNALEAVARTYVDFALRHPGHFRVMFRSDAVPIENYPEALGNADAAFGALVQAIDHSFAGEPPEGRRTLAFACWAFTHGLATLLLDGPLTRRSGVPKGRQSELADKVIKTFAAHFSTGEARPGRKDRSRHSGTRQALASRKGRSRHSGSP